MSGSFLARPDELRAAGASAQSTANEARQPLLDALTDATDSAATAVPNSGTAAIALQIAATWEPELRELVDDVERFGMTVDTAANNYTANEGHTTTGFTDITSALHPGAPYGGVAP
ncbi:MAG: hypothetical protein ACRDPT_08795 [Streptomycetales bacterium]